MKVAEIGIERLRPVRDDLDPRPHRRRGCRASDAGGVRRVRRVVVEGRQVELDAEEHVHRRRVRGDAELDEEGRERRRVPAVAGVPGGDGVHGRRLRRGADQGAQHIQHARAAVQENADL